MSNGAGGQNPSMSRPDVGHSAAGEERHLGERSEHAAQPGMREGAEARQGDMGSAAREQAQSRHQPHGTGQTIGEGEGQLGRGEHGSPNAGPENRAEGHRAGREADQAVQPNREQGKAAEMNQEKKNQENKAAESAKSAESERHGQELGQGRTGRNERQPENVTGQNRQQHGQSAEHAAKNRHQRNQQAAQPSRSETPTAQQQGTQTTGQARQHEGAGQARTRENTGQPPVREHTGQTQNEPNLRGQTASTKINNQQRTQVVDRLRQSRDLERARSDVNIRVNIGERLPERVRPLPLPADIVSVVPEYRGYDYTVVEDEVAIVDPRSREVVDVIPERGYAAENGLRYEGTRVVLSSEQQQILKRTALSSMTVGSTAPNTACLTLQRVPDELVRSNPELASYRYVAIGDQIVLVDPRQRKIVQVID